MPATLNWDLWLGPAPERPYHPAYHPAVWRCWWDFGCGMMGERGVHTLDPVVWALKLGYPTSIEATSLDLNPDTHPLGSVVTYQFPAREGFPPLKLTRYDGLRAPRPAELEDGRQMGHAEGGGRRFRVLGAAHGDLPAGQRRQASRCEDRMGWAQHEGDESAAGESVCQDPIPGRLESVRKAGFKRVE